MTQHHSHKKPKSVPWGDHVLKGRRQRVTAMPMRFALTLSKTQMTDRLKALDNGGLSLSPKDNARG